MKNTKLNWILGAIALLVLPLILQYFGNAWVRLLAARRTIWRAATSSVAMSASLNCRA